MKCGRNDQHYLCIDSNHVTKHLTCQPCCKSWPGNQKSNWIFIFL